MTQATRKLRTNRDKAYYNEADVYDTYKNEFDISFTEFKLILKTFFVIMLHDVIHNGIIFKLPNKIGRFGVLKNYGDTTHIDFNLFKQGIRTTIKNTHSFNYKAKFCWLTAWPNFLLPANMSKVFRYKAPRDSTRALARLLKTNSKAIFKYYDY